MNKALYFLLLLVITLFSCTKDSVSDNQPQWHDGCQLTVAVVAPLADTSTKARLERTAQWLLDNFSKAQAADTTPVSLLIEWHDEQTEDLHALGSQLAGRDDVAAVIGPFDNEHMSLFAPYCQKTRKPLIAPATTSEAVLRRYAVASAGPEGQVNKEAFFWPLCQSDVTLTETILSHYVTQMGLYANWGYLNCAFFSPDNNNGQTFFDWAPFFADKMDIELQRNLQYASMEELLQQMTQYLDEIEKDLDALLSNNFCVVENEQQLYEAVRQRRDCMVRNDGGNPDDPVWDSKWQTIEAILRTWFVCPQLSEERLASLGSDAVKMLQGYQGFSPYADPSTGFEQDYIERYGVRPTFAECKLYDALLLAAIAAWYSDAFHSSLNTAIYSVAASDGNSDVDHGEPLWRADALRSYLSALSDKGFSTHLCGTSGCIAFDRTSCSQLARTAYVHWQISGNRILHPTYYGVDGKQIADSTVSMNIFYDERAAASNFADMAHDVEFNVIYPPLADQYAVLVQGSSGMVNYRHQADVLSMYQLLRLGGFDDDHIILIIDGALGNNPENDEPGVIRCAPDQPDLLGGSTAGSGFGPAVVDYDNASLTPADISDMLKQIPSGSNILLYWSGHGRNELHGGVVELQWLDSEAGQGMTFQLLQQTLEEMTPRKMLIILEPCYSEGVARAAKGQMGVLVMTGASSDEQSWAENWTPVLGRYGTWMCDRFTLNVVHCLQRQPLPTYRDLYFYCMQNTVGSHVKVINAENFGNLYRLTPEEFIKYQ